MEEIVIPALVAFGAILVLGFIGSCIFNRTQIPSIVWLLLFGLVMGYIIREYTIINIDFLYNFSGFFAAVAIVIILFDGGINIDIHQLFKGAPRGLLLTVSGFCLSLLATMLIIVGLTAIGVLPIEMKESVIVGILLGTIVGGTSSPIVIPLASRLKNLQDKTKMVLSIESILTDPLCIVIFLAAVYMITSGNMNIGDGVKSLVSTFSVGAVAGSVLGIVWLPVMHYLRKEQFSYILTLAVVFLVYSLTESWWGGAGAISCLMFGLVLGNGKKILKMVNYSGRCYEMDNETKQFHSLTSFVIRTFFFVYLGIMVSFQKTEFIIVGILVLLTLLGLRFISVQISTFRGGFEKDDKHTMATMMPRGLAAAILAINFGPMLVGENGLNLGTAMEGFFQDAAFVVILGTAIICTIGVSVISHYENKKLQDTEEHKSNYDNIDETLNKK